MATRKKTTPSFGYEGILPNLQEKDRVFILKGNATPIRKMIAVKHTSRKPLIYKDGRVTRAIRYSNNQLTPFVDEQRGAVTLEPITFLDGKLIVPSWNINLQKFIFIHPKYNVEFFELDKEQNANVEVQDLYSSLDAQIAAKDLDINDLEAIARVVKKGVVSGMTSSELRRDMIIWAKNNPSEFMDLCNDENLKLRNLAVRSVEMGILHVKQDGRTVVWTEDKSNKIMVAPYGENVYSALAMFFKTDEGLDVLQNITNRL